MGNRAWLAGLLLAAGACGSTGPGWEARAELARAERDWERAGLDSYTYAVERLCFCAMEGRGPVRVRVENGAVTERSYVDSGDAVPSPLADDFPAVEGLFEILHDALEAGAYSLNATYDPDLGFPAEFFIDYRQEIADEELGMRVTEDVAPLP